MLSKQQIMREYRTFVERRDDMTRAYTQHAPVSVAPEPPEPPAPPPTPTAARAPPSLTW